MSSITKITPAKSKRHQDALIEVTQTMQNPFRMYVAQLEKKGREDPIILGVCQGCQILKNDYISRFETTLIVTI